MPPPPNHRRREAVGLLFLTVGIFFSFSLLASLLHKEWMGAMGRLTAHTIYYGLGLSSVFVSYAILYSAVRCFQRQPWLPRFHVLLGFVGLLVTVCLFLQFFQPHPPPSFHVLIQGNVSSLPLGGWLGFHTEGLLRELMGVWGLVLLGIASLLFSLLALSSLSYREAWGRILQGLRAAYERVRAQPMPVEKEQPKEQKKQQNSFSAQPVVLLTSSSQSLQGPLVVEEEPDEEQQEQDLHVPLSAPLPPPAGSSSEPVIRPRSAPTQAPTKPATPEPAKGILHYLQAKAYQLPSLELLIFKPHRHADMDRKAMLDLAQRLEKSLADYQVKGKVTQIHPGPVVNMYEFAPSAGTKLSKITALSSDLAMTLEAQRVRIVAPIPGKAAVGIEVPNAERETVYAKEIFSDPTFAQAKSKLTLALGKDISGTPTCVDLAKMPHLLIAGTTGSGKSVAVNVMISSVLFRASPDEVKMIMIDPKMLELSIYEGIPHLLLPVVTDPKKANLALKWAVDEMERRYELISKSSVRDIGAYNQKVEQQGSLPPPPVPEGEEPPEPLQKLPYIIVLIDEFADLMMVASKEVEVSVARIAQKARAAGIHLILATQRPSVDVITGLIKANFPSRIAFQVASRIDSRTILDHQGAESLLGMGDMLFTDRGQALRRVHGALITDEEIHKMVEHLKKQGSPIYNMDILKPREGDEEGVEEEGEADELYDQAVRIVSESRQASISMVQRRLRIGYNRAARLIEQMEREGIVSGADGAKGREVLIHNL